MKKIVSSTVHFPGVLFKYGDVKLCLNMSVLKMAFKDIKEMDCLISTREFHSHAASSESETLVSHIMSCLSLFYHQFIAY